MNNNDSTRALVEEVVRVLQTYTVEGIVYADEAGTGYRVMRDCVALGGDYASAEDADEACRTLNAKLAVGIIRNATLDEAAKVAREHDPAFSATNGMLDEVADGILSLKSIGRGGDG